MLFRVVAVVLVGGLGLEVAATPLANQEAPVLAKRNVPGTHTLHERSMPHWSYTWTKRDKVPADALLPMRIGLRQSNLDQGHTMLMERSNPKSRLYGKHLTSEEVIDLFAPSEESVTAVTEWLHAAGINKDRVSQSANKQWIQFDALAAEVEDLLFTDFFLYEHGRTGSQNIACDEYHIPSSIQQHVDYITPGIRLRPNPSRVRKAKRESQAKSLQRRGVKAENTGLVPIDIPKSNVKLPGLPTLNSSVCSLYVTPDCIRTQYSVPEGKLAVAGNELGVFESLNDHYSRDDMDVYFQNVYPKIPVGTYPIEKLIDGAIGHAETVDQVGAESDLDFQAAMPLIYPQSTILFQTDDQYYELNQTSITTPYLGFWNTFFDALDGSYCTYDGGNCKDPACLDPVYPNPNPGGYNGTLMCGVYKPTNVISISYGGGEADLPASYVQRQCKEIMKLGLQGVSIVISSGDDGVGSYEGDGGYPSGCAGSNGTIFYPATDATCPYVLAVGSTELDLPPGVSINNITKACKLQEKATSRFPSGGGFSNVFDTADWQRDAVDHYFKTVSLNFTGYTNPGTNFSTAGGGVYHIGGRGYPDVSAIGDRYIVRYNASWYTIGGTSLSAPVWASLLTLVNEQRIAANKSTMGFVNPILYAHPEVFEDITEGSNPNCRTTGFLAAPGWDPVTGLG